MDRKHGEISVSNTSFKTRNIEVENQYISVNRKSVVSIITGVLKFLQEHTSQESAIHKNLSFIHTFFKDLCYIFSTVKTFLIT